MPDASAKVIPKPEGATAHLDACRHQSLVLPTVTVLDGESLPGQVVSENESVSGAKTEPIEQVQDTNDLAISAGEKYLGEGSLVNALRALRLKLDASFAALVGASSWISLQLTTSHCLECWATRLLPAALVAGCAGLLLSKYERTIALLKGASRQGARAIAENVSDGEIDGAKDVR